jgi:hypothetical protein
MQNPRLKEIVDRWLWLCPALAILVAGGVLITFGVSFWTALFAGVLLFCPAVIVWGLVTTRRKA